MTVESTLLIVKPDGVRRGLVGEVLRRAEAKGLEIEALKMFTIDRELAEEHYDEHREKPFFAELVRFITNGSVSQRHRIVCRGCRASKLNLRLCWDLMSKLRGQASGLSEKKSLCASHSTGGPEKLPRF